MCVGGGACVQGRVSVRLHGRVSARACVGVHGQLVLGKRRGEPLGLVRARARVCVCVCVRESIYIFIYGFVTVHTQSYMCKHCMYVRLHICTSAQYGRV